MRFTYINCLRDESKTIHVYLEAQGGARKYKMNSETNKTKQMLGDLFWSFRGVGECSK